MTNPINAEARGQLREWKRKAAARFTTYNDELGDASLRREIEEFARRGSSRGRARAFDKLRRCFAATATLEGARLDGVYPLAVWTVLKPREAVVKAVKGPGGEEISPEPGDAQDCVVVEYFVAGVLPGRIGWADGLWTLEITDHALGRLLQRSPGADLDAVLLDAHHAALRARLDDVTPALAQKANFLLPAGTGAFCCEIRAGIDTSAERALLIYLSARTWLHNDQLHADQTPLLIDGAVGNRLGEGALLPLPLRQLIKSRANRVRVAAWAPGMPETLGRPIGRA